MRVQLPVCLALLVASATAEEMSLKQQLDAKKAAFEEMAPAEKIAMYQEGIDEVSASGIYDRAKKVGDAAPDFGLTNQVGETVRLSELLRKGPVVLTWYRGGWCPYCNLTLAALQKALPQFQALGATLVALTPELPDHSLQTAEKNALEFEVLSDVGQKVAREYGVVFKMSDDVAAAMRSFAKTHERNGDESDELPLSATYVINTDGEITYAFLDAEYRNRAEPSRLVDALQAIRSGPTGEHMLLQFWENVWNPPYDIDLADRSLSEDFVLTNAGPEVVGRSAFKSWVKGFQSKVGDMRLENLEIFTSQAGDRVVSRWICRGRNKGLFDTEADGREIEFSGIAIWEVRDGKLTHNWVERSAYELFQDLTEAGAE
jgi:peroxiredoxin/predicted ester cyclase